MAQVNLTLTHEEVLQVMTGDRESAMKFLLRIFVPKRLKVRITYNFVIIAILYAMLRFEAEPHAPNYDLSGDDSPLS